MQAAKLTPREEVCACPDTANAPSIKKNSFDSIVKLSVTALLGATLQLSALACDCSTVKVPASGEKIDSQEGYKWSLTPECKEEFHKAVEQAKAFCADYKKQHPNENLAIVSDIDETVLDNRPILKEFTKDDWPRFFAWIQESKAEKLPDSAAFLHWARENGFYVFFVTGRHEVDRGITIVNLKRQGIDFDGLYLRADGDDRAAEDYKAETRAKIEKMGFKVVENIGDQYSDLAGGHSLDCQKLPNRMYFIR
ncbi:MAG TPA: HAD family acid phosphatase [Oculatellaceae cyanobacterium]